MTQIYVIDTETTGLNGIVGGDTVLEIGIARVDTDALTVQPIYDQMVKQELTEEQRRGWVFTHTDMRPEDIENAQYGIEDITAQLENILYNEHVTAFNKDFDFGLFLNQRPYFVNHYTIQCPDIMLVASTIDAIPRRHAGGDCYCTMMSAYTYLCPNDPANLNGHQNHRAVSDAIAEGYILLELCERGLYDIDRIPIPKI